MSMASPQFQIFSSRDGKIAHTYDYPSPNKAQLEDMVEFIETAKLEHTFWVQELTEEEFAAMQEEMAVMEAEAQRIEELEQETDPNEWCYNQLG